MRAAGGATTLSLLTDARARGAGRLRVGRLLLLRLFYGGGDGAASRPAPGHVGSQVGPRAAARCGRRMLAVVPSLVCAASMYFLWVSFRMHVSCGVPVPRVPDARGTTLFCVQSSSANTPFNSEPFAWKVSQSTRRAESVFCPSLPRVCASNPISIRLLLHAQTR